MDTIFKIVSFRRITLKYEKGKVFFRSQNAKL